MSKGLILWMQLLSIWTLTAMAVDRSKFRTCQQTSFCRRQRPYSGGSYSYALVPDSLQLIEEAGGVASEEERKPPEEEASRGSGGVWKSLSQRLLGGSSGRDESKDGALDPYVRGPAAQVTGQVRKEFSDGEATDDVLEFSLVCLANGVVRLRLTEVYGQAETAYENARVTYDEVVLDDPDAWQKASQVTLVQGAAAADPLLHELVATLGPEADPANYVVVRYGESDEHNMALLLQVQPFVVRLYRTSHIQAGPIVVLGEEGKLNFEIRRFRDASSRQLEEEETANEEEEDVETKSDKEIVGYWEDGLAIYADGTREEKKDIAKDEEEQEEEATHRKLSEGADREGLWEEKFGSHHDSKPQGPMSLGWDVRFPQSRHLYGIPEHAASAVLQTTKGPDAHFQEPYRLYNLDVFEYELDETMALYGAVPLVVSQSTETGTAGVFWFNPTETFLDVTHPEDGSRSTTTHWMSESGVIDVFLLPGPDPRTLYQQYAALTGTTPVPPMFSLGYHQCRWNYKDEADVYHVHGKFEELDYPYDVLWLDIEHTNGKRYFTWDKDLFPTPQEMQEKLASQGRRMVTIVDPHIKRDDNYYIHKEATAKGLYVKKADGVEDYDGWCWPGSSSYLDFTNADARQWWAEQFSYTKYKGSTPTLFTWNDMNEPSVFNGPEVSMQKDLKNLAGDEHREWHNIYGMLFQRATGEGLIQRNPGHDIRPFVLSRSFFAGSQRYGAIWTGDNEAKWEHLQIAAPMLLSLNTAALSFVGADVGGFFGNTDAELFTRWMQAGAYQPFFRGHAHHDSARREPWMFDDDTLHRLRKSSVTRYALLPFWYTLFYEAKTTGMPVMRMMWMEYPREEALYHMDHQYLVGADLLVHPVIEPETDTAEVVFPARDSWYDVETLQLVSEAMEDGMGVVSKVVQADLDQIPVYQRGGSILPRKLRVRRSSMLMQKDPYTLYVALDRELQATGKLYMDDEESFGYTKRDEYALSTLVAKLDTEKGGSLVNTVAVGSGWTAMIAQMESHRMVERIVVMGLVQPPRSLSVGDDEPVEFTYDAETHVLVIRKPSVSALRDWTLRFHY